MAFPNRLNSVNKSTGNMARNVGRPIAIGSIIKVQEAVPTMSTNPQAVETAEELQIEGKKDKKALQIIGWFSVGMAVAALGIYLGAELRSRSKFKKRTPYDFYANAGEQQTGEFGVGI